MNRGTQNTEISFEPIISLRDIKGPALSVLAALVAYAIKSANDQALSGVEELERKTNYTDKPVSQALTMLAEEPEYYRVVTKEGRSAWRLSDHARQIPFIAWLFAYLTANDINVRSLKGCPLSVVIALALSGQPVSAQYLERETGYSDKTVEKALALLTSPEHQLATNNGRYLWQIAPAVRQLPITVPADDSEILRLGESPSRNFSGSTPAQLPAPAGSASQNHPENGGLRANVGQNTETTRNFSESEFFPSSSGSSVNLNNLKDSTPTTNGKNSDSDIFRLNFAECRKFGIGKAKSEQLARLPHATPELIRGHCLTAENIRLAIYRITDDWPLPPTYRDPEAEPETEPEAAEDAENFDNPNSYTHDEPETPPVDPEDASTWSAIRGQLQAEMRRGLFLSYVEPLELIGVDRDTRTLHLRTANADTREWVMGRLKMTITNLLSALLEGPATLEIDLA